MRAARRPDVRGRASPPFPVTGMKETAPYTQPSRFPATHPPFSPTCSARGLADERYVVERYKAMSDGDVRRWPGDETPAKGRRKAKRTIATLNAVRYLTLPVLIYVILNITSGGLFHALPTARVPQSQAERWA